MVEARSFPAAPIHSILVPLDGSRLAESAISAAVALAKPARAVITLFHVLETDPPNSIHGEPHLSRQDEAIAYLEALSARFQESGVVISIHVHEDPEKDVSLSIVNHSEELDVSLIVLANHGTGGIRGFFFGRVAQQIVQRGKKPVIAVPTIEPLFAHTRFNRLALLLNRTTESEAAIPISARLATEFSASLHLICAVPTIGTLAEDRSASATLLPSAARELLNIEVQDTHRYLGGIASQLTRQNISVTYSVVRGEPARASIDEAIRTQSELLIFTTHARGGLSGIWSGSVGSRILARAQVPLLLVPAPE